MSKSTNSVEFKINDYVLLTGKEGYIRYIGERVHRHSQWYGIELIVGNGPNNGSEYGEKYFSCEPGKGIFVRSSAIKCTINPSPTKKSKSKSKSKQNVKKYKSNKKISNKLMANQTIPRRKSYITKLTNEITFKNSDSNIKPSVYIKHKKRQKKKKKNKSQKSKTNVSNKQKSIMKTRKFRKRDFHIRKIKQLDINNDTSDSDETSESQNEMDRESDSLNKLKKWDFIKTFDAMKYGENDNKNNLENGIDESESYSEISIVYSIGNGNEYIKTNENVKQTFVLRPDTPKSFESNKDYGYEINLTPDCN